MMEDDKQHLHRQLVKLGDMMGDGLHLEPGGKWISRDYSRVMRALGMGPARANNSAAINERMAKALPTMKCECGGALRQTRSGSMRAQCVDCRQRYQVKRRKVVGKPGPQ